MKKYTVYFITHYGERSCKVWADNLTDAGELALLEIDSDKMFLGFVLPTPAGRG